MKYKYSTHLSLSQGQSKTHHVSLNLDLSVADILRSAHNIKGRLQVGERVIRGELFKLVAEQIVPNILSDTGFRADLPDEHVKTDAQSKVNNEASVGIPTRSDTALRIENKMNVELDITSDRPMTAIQALYASRGGLASDITNSIMRLLKKGVLGVHDTESESSWSLTDNEVNSYTHDIKKSSADTN